jgi:hypothetical protein
VDAGLIGPANLAVAIRSLLFDFFRLRHCSIRRVASTNHRMDPSRPALSPSVPPTKHTLTSCAQFYLARGLPHTVLARSLV